MAHAAVALVREGPQDEGMVEVTLLLACGCTVERLVRADRIVQGEDGRRFAAGKFACPEGHPVRPPSSGG